MTLHQHIKGNLRQAGLTRRQCKSIIYTAKCMNECKFTLPLWDADIYGIPIDIINKATNAIAHIGIRWLQYFGECAQDQINALIAIRHDTHATQS